MNLDGMSMGFPTLLEMPSLEECAALCRELGFAFVEISMNLPAYQAGRLRADTFLALREKYGVYFTIHLDENFNPFGFNDRVCAAYLDTLLEVIEIAQRAEIPVLNMHLPVGVYFKLPDRKEYLFEKYADAYFSKVRVFRDKAIGAVGAANLKICVENTDGYRAFQKETISLLLESPAFALTLDVGHSACAGYVDEPFILQHADRLRHLHLHDAADEKNHLTLGTGALDLQKYLSLAAEHSCRVVVETKTVEALRQSAVWLKDA